MISMILMKTNFNDLFVSNKFSNFLNEKSSYVSSYRI